MNKGCFRPSAMRREVEEYGDGVVVEVRRGDSEGLVVATSADVEIETATAVLSADGLRETAHNMLAAAEMLDRGDNR